MFLSSFMHNGRNAFLGVDFALPEYFRLHARNSVNHFHTEIIFSLFAVNGEGLHNDGIGQIPTDRRLWLMLCL